jgi:stringent starvation protein B
VRARGHALIACDAGVNQSQIKPMADTPDEISPATPATKPYFLRALYEWCTDNGFTPYIAVVVDATTRVPNEYVKDGQIVLNVSFDATSNLKISNDTVSFAARFGGVARDINVPIERVAAIYARENGQGMAFEVTETGTGAVPALTPAPVPAQQKKNAGAVPALAVAPVAVPVTDSSKALAGASAADAIPLAPAEPPKKGGKPKFTVVK